MQEKNWGVIRNMLCFECMNQEQTMNDILNIVEFLKDNMVTRDEFNDLKDKMVTRDEFNDLKDNMVTKGEFYSFKEDIVTKNEFRQTLTETKTEIMSHVDRFIVLHQKLDTELVALRAKYDRLEGFVKQLARHANITLEY